MPHTATRWVSAVLALAIQLPAVMSQGGESLGQTCQEGAMDLLSRYFRPGVHAVCEHKGYYYIGGVFNTAGVHNLGDDQKVQNFARYKIEDKTWEALPLVGPDVSLQWAQTNQGQAFQFLGAVKTLACPANQDHIYVGGFFSEVGATSPPATPGSQCYNHTTKQLNKPGDCVNSPDFINASATSVEAHGFARFDTKSLTFMPLVYYNLGKDGKTINQTDERGRGFQQSSQLPFSVINTIACIDPASCDVMFVGGLFGQAVGIHTAGIVKLDLTGYPAVQPTVTALADRTTSGAQLSDFGRDNSSEADGGIPNGLVFSIKVVDKDFIIIGGAYLGAGQHSGAAMISTWQEGYGFSCVKSDQVLKQLTSGSCAMPFLCCTALIGYVSAIEMVSKSVFLVGGQFQVSSLFGGFGFSLAMLTIKNQSTFLPTAQCTAAGAALSPSCYKYVRQAVIIPLPSDQASDDQKAGQSVWNYVTDRTDTVPYDTVGLAGGAATVLAIECKNKGTIDTGSDAVGRYSRTCLVGGNFKNLNKFLPKFDKSSPPKIAGVGVHTVLPCHCASNATGEDCGGLDGKGMNGLFAIDTNYPADKLDELLVTGSTPGPSLKAPFHYRLVIEGGTVTQTVRAVIPSATGDTVSIFAGLFDDNRTGGLNNVANVSKPDKLSNYCKQKNADPVCCKGDSSLHGTAMPLVDAHPHINKSVQAVYLSLGDDYAYQGVRTSCLLNELCPITGIGITCPRRWGLYCPPGQKDLTDPEALVCEAGFYCPEPYQKIICPRGSYCPVGSTHTFDCPILSSKACDKPQMERPSMVYMIIMRVIIIAAAIIIIKAADWLYYRNRDINRKQRDEDKWNPRLADKKRRDTLRTSQFRPLGAGSGRDSSSGRNSPDGGAYSPPDVNPTATGGAPQPRQARNLKTFASQGSNLATPNGTPRDSMGDMGRSMNDSYGGGDESVAGIPPVEATIDIEFQDLGVVLANGKRILQGVTGKIRSGRVTAIMGPSGAGKTTFLSALSDRIEGGQVVGTTKLNGVEIPMSAVSHVTGFVPQEDTMHRNLTVKQNLEYYAMLKLDPDKTSKVEMQEMVTQVMMALQMVHIRHSLIGDEKVRGISGGQRKRVNVAIELMGNPILLFLDEPTSGLDSTSTEELVGMLSTLAKSGMTVAMVIHQPRYEVYEMIDDLVLLGKGGRTVFAGPSGACARFFDQVLGFEMPERANPPDFFLDKISEEPMVGPLGSEQRTLFQCWDEYLADGSAEREANADIMKSGLGMGGSNNSMNTSTSNPAYGGGSGARNSLQNFMGNGSRLQDGGIPSRQKPDMSTQLWVMMKRSFIQQSHAKMSIFYDIMLLIVIGALTGIAVKQPKTQFTLATLIVGLTATLSSLQIFGPESAVFKREARSGISSVAYLLGKVLAFLPRILFAPVFFMLIYVPAAWPVISSAELYTILLAAVCTTTAMGIWLTFVIDEKNLQVAAVILVLTSTLFAGTTPTLEEMESQGTWGVLVMYISYSRWCAGSLSIAAAKNQPPIILKQFLAKTNSIGYTDIPWTTYGSNYPDAEYAELQDAFDHYNLSQFTLFGIFFILAFISISWTVVQIKHRNSPYVGACLFFISLIFEILGAFNNTISKCCCKAVGGRSRAVSGGGNERDSSNKLQWQNAKGGDDIDNPIDYNPKGKVARKAPAGKGLKQPLLDGDDL